MEVVGDGVTEFCPGDEGFGDGTSTGFGGFAEFATVPTNALALKPSHLTSEEAASLPVAGLAALRVLRDYGSIEARGTVLENGASGGVGSVTVQIAKAYDPRVTDGCGTEKVDFVGSLGADPGIDYRRVDVLNQETRYDIVIDAAAYHSPWAYRRLLEPCGTYVLMGGTMARLVQAMLPGPSNKLVGDRRISVLESEPKRRTWICWLICRRMGRPGPPVTGALPSMGCRRQSATWKAGTFRERSSFPLCLT